MKRIRKFFPLILIALLAVVALVYLRTQIAAQSTGPLQASGTIEATEITIAPEVGGRVTEVLAVKGQAVAPQDVLYRLDDTLLQAQMAQAQAAVAGAQAALDTATTNRDSAQAALQSAQTQYQIALQAARQAERPQRTQAWLRAQPADFSLPVWYYQQEERIASAQRQLQAAEQTLQDAQTNFDRVVQRAASADFLAAEARLADAQVAYQIAQDVLTRANAQNDANLQLEAQKRFDIAQSELNNAQLDYDQMLTTQEAQDILEARARLTVALEERDAARDYLDSLMTGEHSLQVQAAQDGVAQAQAQVSQAEAALTQAEKALAQAQAQVDLLQVQLDKLTVRAGVQGIVLARDVEPGEVLAPGAPAIVLGDLDHLRITVYMPEDRYGEITLGQTVTVRVDSFPNETFQGQVVRIADKAEYTPRNVQTAAGRRTTVFAIEISVQDSTGKLKPGMPADVFFGQ